MNTQGCSLNDDKARRVLGRLHRKSRSQRLTLVRIYLAHVFGRLMGRAVSAGAETRATKDLYLPVSSK